MSEFRPEITPGPWTFRNHMGSFCISGENDATVHFCDYSSFMENQYDMEAILSVPEYISIEKAARNLVHQMSEVIDKISDPNLYAGWYELSKEIAVLDKIHGEKE